MGVAHGGADRLALAGHRATPSAPARHQVLGCCTPVTHTRSSPTGLVLLLLLKPANPTDIAAPPHRHDGSRVNQVDGCLRS
jgi:hypothetical protein